MSSPVNLCNQALVQLGEAPVLSLADDSDAARLCDLQYNTAKRYILRQYEWRSAIKRATLAEDANAPINEYPFAFTLPADCIYVMDVYVADKLASRKFNRYDDKYQIEGNRILTWDQGINVRYIADIPEENMDEGLTSAIIMEMKCRLALPLTGSNTTKKDCDTERDTYLEEAKTQSAVEQPNRKIQTHRLITVRR